MTRGSPGWRNRALTIAAWMLIVSVASSCNPFDPGSTTSPTATAPATTATSTTIAPTTTTTLPKAVVKLVDVDAVESDGLVTLDVKVLNEGNNVGFLTHLVLDITWYSSIIGAGFEPASGSYDAALPRDVEAPFVFEVPISQSVDPAGADAVDRFEVTLTPEPGGPAGSHNYTFTVHLLYDGGQRTQSSEEFDVMLTYRVDD